jgi:flagellar hook-associated protein 1 FlgK
VLQRADGAIDVTLTSGKALVIGASAYALETTSSNPPVIRLGDADVTADFTSGRLGGLLQVRDTIIPGYMSRLDQLAYDVASAVNSVHATGYDANGNAAGAFFAPLAGVAGAASSLTVESALVSDSRLVAASGTGASGDNTIARALAALRDANISNGGTRSAHAAWSQIVYAVGGDAAAARASENSHSQVVAQLEQMRAQASGVSYDEEAANLMRYQRAYEANARYFKTILDTLDTLMEMVQ